MPKPTRNQARVAALIMGGLVPNMVAPVTVPRAGKATVLDLVLRAETDIIRSAGINRTVTPRASLDLLARAAGETLTGEAIDAQDLSLELNLASSREAPVASGNLASSFLDGRSNWRWLGGNQYVLDSSVPYSWITHAGGDTGRNGATHINPSFCWDAAANSVSPDIEIDRGNITDGGAAVGGGARGFDRIGAASIFRALAA